MPLNILLLTTSFILLITASCAFASEEVTIDFEATLEHVEAQLAAGKDDLQLIFIYGMLLAELGRNREAADAFRKMLTRDPDLLRPRLELARVLMLAHDYDSARYHFEQVLAHDVPHEVRTNVLRMLAVIREESPSFTFMTEFMFDTNPGHATSSKEIEIDGLVFRLDDDARASEDTGWRFFFDGRIPFGKPRLWFMRGQFEHLDYDGKEHDFSYIQLASGRHFPINNQTFTLEAGYHWSFYQHDQLYDGVVASVNYFRNLRPDLAMRLNFSALQLDYNDYTHHDGWQYTPSAELTYVSSSRSRWLGGIGCTMNRAKESPYSFDQPYVSLRYVREWKGGWITGLTIKGSRIKYKDADPFFRTTRIEREIRVEADLLNRKIRIWRFSPNLLVGYIDRSSNLDFYTWERNYIRMGMSTEF